MRTKNHHRTRNKRKNFEKVTLFLLLLFSITITAASITDAEQTSQPKKEFELEKPNQGEIVRSSSPNFEWTRPRNVEKQKIQIYENVQGKQLIETHPEKLDNPNIKNTFEIWKDMIEQADNTILIETKYIRYYQYPEGINTTYMELVEALQRAAVEGVEIKILSPDSDGQIKSFAKHPGISLKESVDTHSKLLIVDTENVYVGSANWSGTGTVEKNREVGLHSSNEQIVRTYRKLFSSGWTEAGGSEIKNASLETAGGVRPTGRGAGMPKKVKSISEAELELVREAENKVIGYYYHFSNSRALDDYEKTLTKAASRGIQIELLFDEISKERRVRLTHENIQIREINLGGFKHAHPKFLIVDNRRAHICSANWTSGSHTGEGREIGAKISYQKIVGNLSHIFYTDWNSEYLKEGKVSEDYEIEKICKNRPVIEKTVNPRKKSYELEENLHGGDYYWKMTGSSRGKRITSKPEPFQIKKEDNEKYRTLLKLVLLGIIVTLAICLIYWRVKS